MMKKMMELNSKDKQKSKPGKPRKKKDRDKRRSKRWRIKRKRLMIKRDKKRWLGSSKRRRRIGRDKRLKLVESGHLLSRKRKPRTIKRNNQRKLKLTLLRMIEKKERSLLSKKRTMNLWRGHKDSNMVTTKRVEPLLKRQRGSWTKEITNRSNSRKRVALKSRSLGRSDRKHVNLRISNRPTPSRESVPEE